MNIRPLSLAVATAGVASALGYGAMLAFGAPHVGRMLPWVLGRGLGIAGYLCLVALTAAGLWLRHPWRIRWRRPAVEAQLRLHAVLAALTLVLVAGHVVALVLDTYAGVGVTGAVVPGAASYRPLATALGTVSVYLGLLVGVTAALAGRIFGRAWLPVHRLAIGVLASVWMHAVLAGSDCDSTRTALSRHRGRADRPDGHASPCRIARAGSARRRLMSRTQPPVAVSVDMVRCAGHGICAWLFPERVRLDEWGFAQVDADTVTDRGEQRRARHAERACPRRALHLTVVPTPDHRPTVSS